MPQWRQRYLWPEVVLPPILPPDDETVKLRQIYNCYHASEPWRPDPQIFRNKDKQLRVAVYPARPQPPKPEYALTSHPLREAGAFLLLKPIAELSSVLTF